MIKLLFLLSISFLPLFSATYSAKEAWNHVGEDAVVCGKVAGVFYAQRSKGQPTFINLEKDYPNQLFTIIIWGKQRKQFKDLRSFEGKRLCFRGAIQSYNERPEMVIDLPRQVFPAKS